MRERAHARVRLAPFAAAAVALACAHPAPPPPQAPVPGWPDPEHPAIEWAGEIPGPERPRSPSAWQGFLQIVVGLESATHEPPLLVRPFGLAASGEELWVADPDAAKVVEVLLRTGEHREVRCPHPWVMPLAAAPGADGALYVADAGAGRVLRWQGSSCTEIGAGALERPTGLALAAGRLYVVDPPRHAVVAFAADGKEVARFGGRGSAQGEVNFPTGIASAPDGSLWVVDALNFRMSRFSPDGVPLSAFGEPGDAGGQFARPKAVALDASGRLYVSDAQRDEVLVFRPDGEFEYSFGGTGAERGQLSLPAGLAVLGDRVFVADSYNHRVQIFALKGAAP